MQHDNASFDATKELQMIQQRREEARRKIFRKSRLDKFRAELVAMRQAGGSAADLAEWLRVKHRVKMNRSSVDRYLKSLPELKAFVPARKSKSKISDVNENDES
jgi:hypothetical protein